MGKAHKLTQLQIDRLKTAGLYGDGAGLWLRVSEAGGRYWILRYMTHGKGRWMGIGAYPDIGLAKAREIASATRAQIRQGIDPLDERHSDKASAKASRVKQVTFDWCCSEFIKSHEAGWRNPKHVAQWRSTLENYASPIIGSLIVSQIDTAHIIKVLEPVWMTKPETASRLRGRLENVLDWAAVRKFRVGENPARWKGHLDKLLPAKASIKPVKHHPALPWQDIGLFMVDLRQQAGIAACAVELAILTACRSGEVRGATWQEFDLDAGVWIIPSERMKTRKEHRVPLPAGAIEMLQRLKREMPAGEIVFPGLRGKPLSDMSLSAVLRRMGRNDITVHGFRSAFRDWAAESTAFPHEMAEMALAHVVGNKVEAAYRRGDMFEKRRRMMDDWTKHCDTVQNSAGVTPIRGTTAA